MLIQWGEKTKINGFQMLMIQEKKYKNKYMNDSTLKWNALKAMRGTKYCVTIEKGEISYE